MAKTQKKSRRRLIPKLLLLLAYTAVIAFISAIFFMKNELRRIGFFGTESTAARPPVQSAPSLPPPSGTATQAETTQPPRWEEEISQDDKKQLNDLLRARGGKR